MTRALILSILLVSAVSPVLAQAGAGTANQPTANQVIADQRAAAMLRQMTTEEKIRLLHGPMLRLVQKSKRPDGVAIGPGYIAGIPRLGIPALVENNAGLGVSNHGEARPGDVATALPSSLSQASTWDADLVRAAGAMIGAEARAKGFNVLLAGGVNLVRDPRGGRNFEYLGEDPLLAGTLAGAQIAGVQSNGIISTIKHFAINNQETGRNIGSVDMGEAPMRESDLLAFQIGIETGDPGSVMCAYNRLNGEYACENAFLLTDVLRRDWGYKGFVMSDWGAVHSTEAILKGLDQQSGEQIDQKPYFSTLLEQGVAKGEIPQTAVDKAAYRILRSMYAHGVVDRPVAPGGPIDYEAHGQIALRAAEQGIVLLRNEGDILPLASSAKRIVVIGGHADIGVLSGGGSSSVTPVGGFKLSLKSAPGVASSFATRNYGGTAPLSAISSAFPSAQVTFNDGTDIHAAAAAAKAADIAIVFAEKWSTEAADNEDLDLGDGQDRLIDAVATANRRTVVVLETGNPVAMPWKEKVPAILAAWYPGQHGGEAIARVLSGDVNPSGHLPVTFPASLAQLPNPQLPGSDAGAADQETRAVYGLRAGLKPFSITYPEGSDVGYRWFAGKGERPLYPFGHGLSYTSFRYDGLKITGGRTLTVRFRVTNTGKRMGADVPQVYVVRAGKAKRLIGWGKPTLAPGESREVVVVADPRVIGDYDATARRWIVPSANYQIEVGRSASEVVLAGRKKLAAQRVRP